MSVTLRSPTRSTVSRGDMLVHPDNRPRVARHFDADLVWMHEQPARHAEELPAQAHDAAGARADRAASTARSTWSRSARQPADALELNDIGARHITCHRALYFDAYQRNRDDRRVHRHRLAEQRTVAAGMIRAGEGDARPRRTRSKESAPARVCSPRPQVSPRERRERLGQSGATVWLTGLPGSGRGRCVRARAPAVRPRPHRARRRSRRRDACRRSIVASPAPAPTPA